MPASFTITREMGISHSDFFRIFPAVIHGRSFERLPDGIRFEESERRVLVRLSAESQRRLGMLRIPVTTIRLQFEGHTEAEVESFMARFDRHFHRGGG